MSISFKHPAPSANYIFQFIIPQFLKLYLYSLNDFSWFNTGIFLSATFFVIFIGYYGIRQTIIFSDHSFLEKPDVANEGHSLKMQYQKSGLKIEQANIIKEGLINLMNSKKPFLDNKLSLDSLAYKLGVSSNHLSQVINGHFSKNFYDFINSYRIEDFKNKATDKKYRNFSVLALAYESGFNSKSAFYSAFVVKKKPVCFYQLFK